jgi:methionyl-tRNA synthetase
MKMIGDYRSFQLPSGTAPDYFVKMFEPVTKRKMDSAKSLVDLADSDNYSRYLGIVTEYISATDILLTEVKPWSIVKKIQLLHNSGELSEQQRKESQKQIKESQKQIDDVLYTAAEAIRIITVLLYPVMPYATARVWEQLGLGDIEQDAKAGKLKNLEWDGLQPRTKLGALAPIFPRADKGLIQIMAETEVQNAPQTAATTAVPEAPATAAAITPATGEIAATTAAVAVPAVAGNGEAMATPDTPQIAIDDFVKIDLRVAQIVVAERIPKADKLLRLEVDLGYEKRQILSGIAEWYTPEELVGRRIVVIANLAPRKMRGLESHGMLLAASHGENGKPVLATFGEEIALGSRLK